MLRDPSTGIYPSNMTVIPLQAQCQLTSTSTSTNCLRNGAWNSETLYLHHFHKKADDIVKELAEPVAIHDEKLVKEYPALVGSFLYLQVHTFPEISWAVSVLGKYMIRPGPTHLVIGKKLLCYLKGRKNVSLRWCAQDCTGAHLPGYADASFADTIPHRHSSVGYVFLLNGAALSWRTSRTTLIVLKAAQFELYSLSSTTPESIYLRKVCIELGFLQNSPTFMCEDCQAAVALSKENRFRNRSEHISLRWSFVVKRQSLAIGDLAVVGISRTSMLADIFCSSRPTSSFIPFRNTILGHTHRCPLHCYQLRRGTHLTRYWFMLALNTQRFATVLTHSSTCFSHVEYHYCVAIYQSDVQSELQSVCKENLISTGFNLLPRSHTSINMHKSCDIPLLCDCLSICCTI